MKRFIANNAGKLAIVWAIIIFILCATPGRFIPSANWLELLSVDKWVHAGIFFTLCSLLFLHAHQKQQTPTWVVVFFILSAAYGALLEFMQANYFSQRSADWLDIVANTTGCLIAVIFYNKTKRIFISA